jgi:uncharacterized RDD family membrane protein YckC
MICLKCGGAVPDQSRACPRCATTVISPVTQAADARRLALTQSTAIGDLSRPAGFWLRCCARTIDGIIVVVLYVGFLALLELLETPGAGAMGRTQAATTLGSLIAIILLLQAVYEISYHSLWGCTVGKRLLGLRVVGRDGHTLSLIKAILRWLVYLPSAGLLCAGLVVAGFDRRKQGWHDKIAGSYVVHSV